MRSSLTIHQSINLPLKSTILSAHFLKSNYIPQHLHVTLTCYASKAPLPWLDYQGEKDSHYIGKSSNKTPGRYIPGKGVYLINSTSYTEYVCTTVHALFLSLLSSSYNTRTLVHQWSGHIKFIPAQQNKHRTKLLIPPSNRKHFHKNYVKEYILFSV